MCVSVGIMDARAPASGWSLKVFGAIWGIFRLYRRGRERSNAVRSLYGVYSREMRRLYPVFR